MSSPIQVAGAPVLAVSQALRRACEALLARRREQGYWWGDLTADTTLESDYILLELWLHPPQGQVWNPPSRPKVDRAARSILARQLPDGGFNIYPGGPADVSASVKAYFALRAAGLAPDHPALKAACRRILELGGIQAANSYVKINLSLFGLYPREHCPSVPPEMMLLPWDFIYQMSSWTRAIVIPLAIVQALNRRRPVPAGFTLEELFLPGKPLAFAWDSRWVSWRNFFLVTDRLLKLWERFGVKAVRRHAIRKAERWMLERTRYSDGLGAIYPPMMYAIMALELLGYGPDHPDRREAERQFYNLLVDDGERFFFQPCFSPVWDTAIAAFALGQAVAIPRQVSQSTADWLLSKEVRRKGDWSVKRPNVEPAGWYFEFANEFYPDIDDTAMVLLALRHLKATDPARQRAAEQRAVKWLLAMQSRDGGWAAFDVDNNWRPLAAVPFADHNAMLDPTCPDITGRVLEALSAHGLGADHPAIRAGVDYLMRTQEDNGAWYGRWGVDYIYGTFLALRGLRAAGVSAGSEAARRAAAWLRAVQNPDGGWGESCASYDQGAFVGAPSTASQTAWGLLGLLAAGDALSSAADRAVEYLIATQRNDGGWDEEQATGTGFPKVFYLSYHLYRDSFPVLALAEFLHARRRAQGATA